MPTHLVSDIVTLTGFMVGMVLLSNHFTYNHTNNVTFSHNKCETIQHDMNGLTRNEVIDFCEQTGLNEFQTRIVKGLISEQ